MHVAGCLQVASENSGGAQYCRFSLGFWKCTCVVKFYAAQESLFTHVPLILCVHVGGCSFGLFIHLIVYSLVVIHSTVTIHFFLREQSQFIYSIDWEGQCTIDCKPTNHPHGPFTRRTKIRRSLWWSNSDLTIGPEVFFGDNERFIT
jgi:hypothetical protein